MEAEDIYTLWERMLNFIPQRDREEATAEFLNQIYELEVCEIKDLMNVANDYDNDFLVKECKKFIKEYDLEDDYDY